MSRFRLFNVHGVAGQVRTGGLIGAGRLRSAAPMLTSSARGALGDGAGPPSPPNFRGTETGAPPTGATTSSEYGGSPEPGTSSRLRYVALAAMLFAVAMTFIDQTIVAIASHNIQTNLDLTAAETQWGVNAYLLGLAATFALGGRLADVYGSRRMVLIGIVSFAGASALCGATPRGAYAETWLITFRALQGIAGAMMIPAALAVVVAAFPVDERGRATALFFGLSGGLTAIGPIAGGYLTQWTWRAVFWVNIPVAVIALVLALAARIAQVGRRERVDLLGAVLVAGGMTFSVLGLEQARTWGWRSPLTIGALILGAVLLVIFVAVELRTPVPLLRLEIFRGRAFIVDNVVLFLSNIAFIPVFFFASLYAQVSIRLSAQDAGLYLLVFFAGFAPAAQIGGRILDRRGARRPMVIGSAMATAGFIWWAVRITDLSLSHQWGSIVLAGAGIGLLLGPASTDAVNRAINASYGEVTGITQTVRNYAAALGIAVLGTVFGTVYANRLADLGPRPKAVIDSFAIGTRGVLIGMAVALGISFVVALAHPGDRVSGEPEVR